MRPEYIDDDDDDDDDNNNNNMPFVFYIHRRLRSINKRPTVSCVSVVPH